MDKNVTRSLFMSRGRKYIYRPRTLKISINGLNITFRVEFIVNHKMCPFFFFTNHAPGVKVLLSNAHSTSSLPAEITKWRRDSKNKEDREYFENKKSRNIFLSLTV